MSQCVFSSSKGCRCMNCCPKNGTFRLTFIPSPLCLGPCGVLWYFHLLLLFLLLLFLLWEVQRCRRRGLCLYWPRGPRGRDQRIWRRWGLCFFWGGFTFTFTEIWRTSSYNSQQTALSHLVSCFATVDETKSCSPVDVVSLNLKYNLWDKEVNLFRLGLLALMLW